MNDKTIEMLEKLAAKLSTTTEHLWAVLTAQARVEAWTDLMTSIALLVAAAGLVCVSRYSYKRCNDMEDDLSGEAWAFGGGFVLATVGCAIAVFIAIGLMRGVPTNFINPEYFALKELRGFIGK